MTDKRKLYFDELLTPDRMNYEFKINSPGYYLLYAYLFTHFIPCCTAQKVDSVLADKTLNDTVYR